MTQPWWLSGDHVLTCHCWTLYTKHLHVYIYQVSRQLWSPRGIGGKHDRSRTSNSKSSRKGLPLCAAFQQRTVVIQNKREMGKLQAACLFWIFGLSWERGKLDSMRDPWDIGVQSTWKAIVLRALEAACLGDFTVPEETFASTTLKHPHIQNIQKMHDYIRIPSIFCQT